MANFINPYNFVPLGNGKKILPKGNEKLTGYIGYRLKTKSSIFIPNTSCNSAFKYEKNQEDDPEGEHVLQDFFSLNTILEKNANDNIYYEPSIPGSEIRGVIRSIYETLTASCISQVNEDVKIGKRTVEHFLPGILKRENGEYRLYEAEDALLRNKSDFSERKYMDKALPMDGSAVSVTLDSEKTKGKKKVVSLRGTTQGYLIKGEAGPEFLTNKKDINQCFSCIMNESGKCNHSSDSRCYKKEKHCAHVFYVSGTGKRAWRISEADVKNLGFVLEQYQKETAGAYGEYNKTYKAFMNTTDGKVNSMPVYYSIISSTRIMLSPACITREVYNHTVKDAIKEWRRCLPKRDEKDNLCAACALFGLINPDGFSKGSMIRFTDLKLVNADSYQGDYKRCYDDKLFVMPELSQPRISNSEFYLARPVDPDGDVWFWTYDYYTVKKKDGTVVVKEYTPTILGRKFYWHGSKIEGYTKKTKRNKTVRTVKKGICFEGKIYFDGITKKQLDQLLYIMRYTTDEKRGFKIGSGKPVGLGSFCLSVGAVKLRTYDGTYNVKDYVEDYKEWGQLDFDATVKNSFDAITQFLPEEDAKIVHYPGVNAEGDEGFAWFVRNKSYHKLASYRNGENKLNLGDSRPDSSPRARIQTEIRDRLEAPENNKYLSEETKKEKDNSNLQHKYSGDKKSNGMNAGYKSRNNGNQKWHSNVKNNVNDRQRYDNKH